MKVNPRFHPIIKRNIFLIKSSIKIDIFMTMKHIHILISLMASMHPYFLSFTGFFTFFTFSMSSSFSSSTFFLTFISFSFCLVSLSLISSTCRLPLPRRSGNLVSLFFRSLGLGRARCLRPLETLLLPEPSSSSSIHQNNMSHREVSG